MIPIIKSVNACCNQVLSDFFFFRLLPLICTPPPYVYMISYGAPYVKCFFPEILHIKRAPAGKQVLLGKIVMEKKNRGNPAGNMYMHDWNTGNRTHGSLLRLMLPPGKVLHICQMRGYAWHCAVFVLCRSDREPRSLSDRARILTSFPLRGRRM